LQRTAHVLIPVIDAPRCDVVGLDPSPEMLAQAAKIAAAGLPVRWVQAWAEATGLSDGDFDLVCAGQCWHWFDRPRADLARLLTERFPEPLSIEHRIWGVVVENGRVTTTS
jgi:SAM-dependent methyltransferase